MVKSQIYVIEHLEPKLFEWCLIEYEHISKIVGKDNLWFTNINHKGDALKLKKFGRVFQNRVMDFKLENACILDPEAVHVLSPKDTHRYSYFIFGGILGDYPPKKRTKEELTKFIKNAEERHIGPEQMSTDNAVYTVKQIANGKKFSDLKYKDKISLKINEFENIDLPYRYNLVDGKPFMSPKIIKYLKAKKTF
jgi:ribosome biogenesis SPOUT family RNA methylase Rps3